MYLLKEKQRRAFALMAELAHRGESRTMEQMTEAIDVCVSYGEQCIVALRNAGLVCGQRGPGGGYVLTRSAATITLANIARAVIKHEAPPEQKDKEVDMLSIMTLSLMEDATLEEYVALQDAARTQREVARKEVA